MFLHGTLNDWEHLYDNTRRREADAVDMSTYRHAMLLARDDVGVVATR